LRRRRRRRRRRAEGHHPLSRVGGGQTERKMEGRCKGTRSTEVSHIVVPEIRDKEQNLWKKEWDGSRIAMGWRASCAGVFAPTPFAVCEKAIHMARAREEERPTYLLPPLRPHSRNRRPPPRNARPDHRACDPLELPRILLRIPSPQFREPHSVPSIGVQLQKPGRHNLAAQVNPLDALGPVVVVWCDQAGRGGEVQIPGNELARDAEVAVGETAERGAEGRGAGWRWGLGSGGCHVCEII
jgi:hypothetical protein